MQKKLFSPFLVVLWVVPNVVRASLLPPFIPFSFSHRASMEIHEKTWILGF